MKSRRQALSLCLDTIVVVIVEIFDEFVLEVLHGFKLLQIKEFALEQAEEVLHNSIVQAAAFSAHALPDALLLEHPLIPFVLILPALV